MVSLPLTKVTRNVYLEIENHAHCKIHKKERKANKDDRIDSCPYRK